MKTEITEIKIKLSKDKEIVLSTDEARKLHRELGLLLFDADTANRSIIDELKKLLPAKDYAPPQKEYVPYPVYPAPIVVQPNHWPQRWWGDIWCGTTSCGLGGGSLLGT